MSSRADLIERLTQLAYDYASAQIHYQEKADRAGELYEMVTDRVVALTDLEEGGGDHD